MQMCSRRQLNLECLAMLVADFQLMLMALRFVELDDGCALEQSRCQTLATGQELGDEQGGGGGRCGGGRGLVHGGARKCGRWRQKASL